MIRDADTKKMVRIAMLCAVSVVFMLLVRFPLIPAAPYMEYTPADIPILIASFLYGPLYGLAAAAVVSIIQGITVSAASGIIGMVMNFATSSAMCVVAGLFYQRRRTLRNAVLGLVFGGIATILTALPLNVLLTPLFMPFLSMRDVAALLVPVILPFNAVKVVINGTVTMFVYKTVSRLFAYENQSENGG